MPIYSYKCENCERIFDKFQKIGGDGNIKCVYCDSNANRLFSPVGIIFKGSGFYTTDYKSSSGNFNNTGVSTNKEKDNKKSKTKSSDKKETSSVSDKKNN